MEKVKITFYALLATAVVIAIFLAVLKVAVFLSTVFIVVAALAIIYCATKFWPRKPKAHKYEEHDGYDR